MLRDRAGLSICRAAAAALLATPACVTYQPRPLRPETTAAVLEARRLDGSALRGCMEAQAGGTIAPWPPAAWGLRELTGAAFCLSPELAGARAALATAQAALVTAGARQEPALAITAERQSNAEHGVSPWTVGPAFDIPLTTAGKREIRSARARNLAEAARLDVLAAAWAVRSRVRAALVEARAGERLTGALRAEADARRAVLASLEVQRAAGAIPAPEVATARAELESLEIEMVAEESGIALARVALAAAIGVQVEALRQVVVSAELPELPGSPAGAAERATALQTRYDVLAALARYEASQDDLRLAIAGQYPDLHLGPGFLWDQGASRWQLGLALALPLLERNRGPIGEAEARRAEAGAHMEAVQARVIAAVDAATAELDAAAALSASADALIATNRTLAEAARQSLAAGETTRLDVLLADAGVQRGRRVRMEAWRSAQQALGALEDALQRPLAGEPLPPSPSAAAKEEELARP
jgi:outer membrane protein TolC